MPYSPYNVRLVEIYETNPSIGSPTPIATYTPSEVSTGVYSVEVASGVLTSSNHVYFDKWYFTWKEGETETDIVNDFYVARVNGVNLIGELRILLKDRHPDHDKRRWTDFELEICLENALLDLNVQPPAFTDFTLDDWEDNVPYWKGLIIQGGMIFALINEGIFQIGVEFTYSDQGISINTSKSAKYQSMANMMLQSYQNKKEKMKQQYWFDNSKPRALVTHPLPFSIRTFSSRQWRVR